MSERPPITKSDIPTIPNNALRGFRVLKKKQHPWSMYNRMRCEQSTYHDASKMGVEDSAVFIIASVDLKEMSAEILDDSFVVVGPVAKWSNAWLNMSVDERASSVVYILTIFVLSSHYPASLAKDRFYLQRRGRSGVGGLFLHRWTRTEE